MHPRVGARLHRPDIQQEPSLWDDARRLVAEALPLIERSDEHFYLTRAFALAILIEADRAAAVPADAAGAGEVADALLARLEGALARLRERGVVLLPEPAAEVLTATADAARARGADEPAHWAAAGTAWERLGQPLRVASARMRQADALLRVHGSRGEAAELLDAARATAEGLGAQPLLAEIERVARRSRLAPGAGARRPLDVTPREMDVLRLVAQGRTNRQIGETLFISEKTASVHVTNLLRKLGVASRVEAAALAVRSGVADGAD